MHESKRSGIKNSSGVRMDKVYNMCCSDNVDKIYKHHDRRGYGRHVCVCEKWQYELTLSAMDLTNRRDEKWESEKKQRKSTALDNFSRCFEQRWRFT